MQRFRSERLRVRSWRSTTFTPPDHVRRQSLPVWPQTLNKIALPLPFPFILKTKIVGSRWSCLLSCTSTFRKRLIFGTFVNRTKLRKLLVFGQILCSFSFDKVRRTDSRIRRKNTAQPRRESNPGSCARSVANHSATKPQRELRVNSRLSPSCQFFFCFSVWSGCQFFYLRRSWKRREFA